MFWQGRDPHSPSCENRNPNDNTSPSKRSSIENLKKASRVKNSSMFAREQKHNYDPTRPNILDGRPLSTSFQGNAFGAKILFSASANSSPAKKEKCAEDESLKRGSITPPELLESSPFNQIAPLSPSKLNTSPTKSSLSKKTGALYRNSGFDPVTGIWEDNDEEEKKLPAGRYLHRHAKSVTFDQAPPQVNEYEMTTPDPSSIASGSREGSYESFDDEEEDLSFERGSSFDPHDDSFDASLEDTEKTPVVLPEDWRFMSPATANTDLAQREEDVFDDDVGSPGPEARPGLLTARQHQASVNSVDSNGQARPLPPLPPMNGEQTPHRDSLSSTLERLSGSHRALPFPPPAATVSKADIRRMSNGSLSLEDRLRLMLTKDDTPQRSEAEVQRERRMRRAVSKESSPIRDQFKATEVSRDPTPQPESEGEPLDMRISRDSILQQLRQGQDDISRSNSQYSQASHPDFDPDTPIPSREDPTQHFDESYEDDSIIIKDEPTDDNDLYSIPDLYNRKTSSQIDAEDEVHSQYSQSSIQASLIGVETAAETPRARSPAHEPGKSVSSERMSLPDFMDFGREKSFDFGLGQYISERQKSEQPDKTVEVKDLPPVPPNLPDLAVLRSEITRPFTPEEQLEPPKPSFAEEEVEEPGTPSSVIRHPISKSPSPEEHPEEHPEEQDDVSLTKTSSNVSEPEIAPSITVEDASQEQPQDTAPVPDEDNEIQPPLDNLEPEKKRTGARVSSLVQLDFPRDESNDSLGLGLEKEFDRVLEAQKVAFESSLQNLYQPFHGRFPPAEIPDPKETSKYSIQAYIPLLPKPMGARAPSSPYQGQFANRSSNKQRGYLMRQNTKIVVASERASVDEPRSPTQAETSTGLALPHAEPNEVVTSPRKISQPTWTAEPWNSKSRRRSIRVNGEPSPTKRKPGDGPVPPLPGQASNVHDGLDAVAEDELAEEEAEELEDGAERGRLFVKVVGVKDLQLPFPQRKRPRQLGQIPADQTKDEQTHFALTLDNGLHCVTTAWLDLARSAPIGQEFELVVLNELEFQLTLQMKLEEPKPQPRPESPTKAPVSPKKQNAFGRLFGSPKKKKESDVRAQQEAQAVKRPITPPSAYELVQGLVAKDGSFARAYVSLTEFEKQAYGRPATVDVKCFNEWAMEEVSVGSSRSKKGVIQLQRRPPYEIGKLELQLLYVPKPKGAKDEDMPKSMNGAIRAMREAEERLKQQAEIKEFEGYLSQQGGDCPVSSFRRYS